MLQPDIVFYLAITAEEAIARLKASGRKGELFDKQQVLTRVIKGYEFCAHRYSMLWQEINGGRDEQEVSEEIFRYLKNIYNI